MAAAGDSPDFPPLIPGLPDHISLLCLARIPLSSHLLLSRVSRSWRFTLRSPLLFTLRSELNYVEPLLLLNLRTPSAHSLWFFLDVSTRRIRLLPLPPPPLPTLGSSCVALGHHLFLLGGSLDGTLSPAVQIFDARLRRWALGPSMSFARHLFAVGALSGRIYVLGGCPLDSDSWAESFDPAIGQWAPVPSPQHVRQKFLHESAVLGGKLLARAGRDGVLFDPTADTAAGAWGPLPEKLKLLNLGWRGKAAPVAAEGILYSNELGSFQGYDPVADVWRQVEGVKEELPDSSYRATWARVGGSLCLLWNWKDTRRRGSKDMELYCAGVQVWKTEDGRMRGKIAWKDSAVVALPKWTKIMDCIDMEL